MSSAFSGVTLSDLEAPKIVEPLDAEAILAALITDFVTRYPDFTAEVESEPVLKLLEVAAWREVILRQRVNDAARAVMLAFAAGSDLDHLGALVPVTRNTDETDASFRGRIQLAPEAFSVAGPEGAYQFHALSASATIADVSVASPTPGDVVVTVLATYGDGVPTARETVTNAEVTLDGDSVVLDGETITSIVVDGYTLGIDYVMAADGVTLHRVAGGGIAAGATLTVSYERAGDLELVERVLAREDVRPLTDRVTVQAATIRSYAIVASLIVFNGPDSEVVRLAAVEAAEAYADDQHRLGRDVTLSGLYRALHQPGVQRVALTEPTADIVVAADEAATCTGITVTVGGVDD